MKHGNINSSWSTCHHGYLLLHGLSLPKRIFSDILIPLSISIRVKRALFESLFLKKILISDKIVLFLNIGIGLLVFLVLALKYTNNQLITECPMPFFVLWFYVLFLLAKLEYLIYTKNYYLFSGHCCYWDII